jgi:DNA-binding XRE family transcriptional regulator
MKMDLKCDCGGTLKSSTLTNYDLTEDLGIKAIVGEVRGLRCNRCGWETLPGKTIDHAVHVVAAQIVRLDQRLSHDLARFLRKYLGLTQEGLAKRMGITRKTVNQWETDGQISPQHDLLLRAFVAANGRATWEAGAQALDHVRTALPKAKHRLVVARLDRAA